ncbi:glycosyltransferase [Candidatus Parcubacteria bacterium]|nr:MAG: glycosyltransferase [Candidatus Parcubacteria bacterium]
MNNLQISVVIPAYNEVKNLNSGVLDPIYDYLKKQDYSYEVLIVDDGSTDNTVELVEKIIKDKPGFKIVKNPHGGKALTVISGMLKARGEVVIFTDMDQATPINQIEKILPKFKEGFDIVIGSRSGRKGAPLIRKLSAWGFSVVRNLMLGLPFSDTQCGFKAFRGGSVQPVFSRMLSIWESMKASGAAVNAGFDVEILFLSKKLGYKIAEVSVDWRHVGTERVQLARDTIEALKDILRIRLGSMMGKYGTQI